MKNAVQIALTLLIIAGCAHRPSQEKGPLPSVEVALEKKLISQEKTRALFHIVEPLGVQLILSNMDNHKEHVVLLEKTFTDIPLKAGFWQVSGFLSKGKRYKVMNTSKQFVFHMKKNETSYVGSYIVQCPRVNRTHLKQMKKMSFFNRYPFSSSQGLCEMIVGSDYKNVKRVWAEIQERQHIPLALGF